MSKLLMIGAGGVATVAAFKIAQNADVFTDFMIASRRKEKCDQIVKAIHAKGYNMDIKTAQVDADDVEQLKALFNDYQPELVVNLALPYQDLTIMEACLACGCHYLDTANYEPKDEAHFEYSWQWAYKERFEQAGLTAILNFAPVPIKVPSGVTVHQENIALSLAYLHVTADGQQNEEEQYGNQSV